MSALMLAALLMLLASPAIAWDVGFQLSALATAGLIWFGASFAARLRRWPALIREPVALTMAAQVTTLPVILLNFERLSLIAPVANVLVVPLIPLVMLGSALAAADGSHRRRAPAGRMLVAWLTGGMAFCLPAGHGRGRAGRGGRAVGVGRADRSAAGWPPPGTRRCCWCVAAWRRPPTASRARTTRWRWRAACWHASPVRCRWPWRRSRSSERLTLASGPDGRLHLFALDIGQGDAILVVAPTGETALIDGGPDPDLTLRRLGERLPFWQRRLDVLVLTHPHEDHVAGLLPALERFEVGDGRRSGPRRTTTRATPASWRWRNHEARLP